MVSLLINCCCFLFSSFFSSYLLQLLRQLLDLSHLGVVAQLAVPVVPSSSLDRVNLSLSLSLSLFLSNTLFVSHPTSLSPLPPPSLPLCSVSHLFFFFFFLGGGGLFCLFFVAVLFCFSFVLFSRFLFRIPNTQCKRFMCM